MTKYILDIQNISKSFFNKTTGNNYVLKNLNLSIQAGKITTLIGGNGTGKTTLFNIISQLIKPDKTKNTKILFKGKNILNYQASQLASLGIGRLFQEAHIFPNLSIIDNMCVADDNPFGEKPFQSIIFPKKNNKIENLRKVKAKTILEELFNNESVFVQHHNHLAGNLSYGQQRLLALARLMMADYQLILLDEPTAGVHIQLNNKIADIIQTLKKQGKTIFLIEHNMRFVREISDYIAFIDKHNILTQGNPEDILNNEIVQQQYLGVV